jgi:sugar phosphate isomerase/epimerase
VNSDVNRLGIENISVFGLPPVEFVNLAADLGCANISVGLIPIDYNPHGYSKFSLREDKALRRAVVAALTERSVSISLGEGFTVRPGQDVCEERASDLEVMCELGVKRINTVSMDPDRARTFDQFAALAELGASKGVEVTTELAPGMTVADLPTAVAAVLHVGRSNFKLLIDTMHFARSGASAADLAAIDPKLIGYIQLSDAPFKPRFSSYFEEAMFERMSPSAGELPLLDILRALPRHLPVGIEVPLRSQAEAGVGPRERLSPIVEAARRLLAQLN